MIEPFSTFSRPLVSLAALAALSVLASGCVSTNAGFEERRFVADAAFLPVNSVVSLYTADQSDTCLQSYDSDPDASHLAWCQSYVLNDLVDRIESNGDPQAIATLQSHIERLQTSLSSPKTDALRGRVVNGWTSAKYEGKRPHVWAVHNGMVGYPLARFAYVVRKKGLSEQNALAASALKMAYDLYNAMEPDFSGGTYRYPVSGLGRPKGDHLPLNMQAAMGLLALHLHLADRSNQATLTRANQIGRFINKAAFYRISNGKRRLVWPIDLVSGPEDTGHAILTMSFITKMHENGLVFSKRRYQELLDNFIENAIGTGTRVNADIVDRGGGKGSNFKDTCHRALIIYRHDSPTFNRCKSAFSA
ncbi:MAG: hypothetical protein AAF468_02905 [Pseudomonadota bacterium]